MFGNGSAMIHTCNHSIEKVVSFSQLTRTMSTGIKLPLFLIIRKKYMAQSLLKLCTFPNLPSKSSSQFPYLHAVTLSSFVHLFMCKYGPVSTLHITIWSGELLGITFCLHLSPIPDHTLNL